jgi:hypothetical protein
LRLRAHLQSGGATVIRPGNAPGSASPAGSGHHNATISSRWLHPPVCPSSAPFSSASMSGPDIALHLKIPGVARYETGRQDMAPNPSGGRTARTHASGQLRCRRAHDSPLPGDLCHGLDTPRRTSRSVSRVSGSRLSSVQLSTREDGTCLSRALASATSERCEGNTSFTCVLTSWGGATVIRTGTHPDQLRLRARGTTTPRSRLAGSALQYAPVPPHFHPLPCRAQTSRFA